MGTRRRHQQWLVPLVQQFVGMDAPGKHADVELANRQHADNGCAAAYYKLSVGIIRRGTNHHRRWSAGAEERRDISI